MPQGRIAGLIRQINSALPVDAGSLFEGDTLSFAQVFVLEELFALERAVGAPASLTALARRTGLSKAAICETLKGLQKRGYVRARISRADNRQKELLLTARARAVEGEVHRRIAGLDRTLCAGIAREDLGVLERSLRTILKNAKGAREGGPPAGQAVPSCTKEET